MFSKSAQSPSIILAVHWDTAPSPSSATPSYSPSYAPFFSFLSFLRNKEFYTSVCAWKKGSKRDQHYSPTTLHSESKVNSLALGFGPATLYILTSLGNKILQSKGLFSFASHCCLDIIHLWGNLRTPPSTFAFECIKFIGDVTQVHNVLITTFIQNLWGVYKLYIFGKFRVWQTPKPVFTFFLSLCGGHLGLSKWRLPMTCF